jgi:hypothetical protein
MGFNELYSALQTGVVDGAENNPPTVLAQNHYQVSKVYSLTGHLIIPRSSCSRSALGRAAPADQAMLRSSRSRAQLEQRKLWDEYTTAAEAKLKAAGVQFVPADKKAFYDATQPIRDKYGSKYAALIKRSKRRPDVGRRPGRRARRRGARRLCTGSRRVSDAKLSYQRAMEMLYIACIVCPGRAGRDHADHPARRVHALRDEQADRLARAGAVIMMVMFSFVGGAAVYARNVHIAVEALMNAVKPRCAARWSGASPRA